MIYIELNCVTFLKTHSLQPGLLHHITATDLDEASWAFYQALCNVHYDSFNQFLIGEVEEKTDNTNTMQDGGGEKESKNCQTTVLAIQSH